jgi:hypothetical protein
MEQMQSPVQELDGVALISDWNGRDDFEPKIVSLPAGREGTVVCVLGQGEAFIVEFVAADGSSDAIITVQPDEVRLVRRLGKPNG